MNHIRSLFVIFILSSILFSCTPEIKVKSEDVWHKSIMATFFYVGEPASEENAFIANDDSAFDEMWVEHYGGIDDPENRNGYYPKTFVPKENPFYFALPYSDMSYKNKWIAVRYKENVCYAQWEDVGPYETDDYEYVFEFKSPRNQFGMKAGLDLSPAMRDCLKMEDNDYVDWKFVDKVPEGPWKEIVTR